VNTSYHGQFGCREINEKKLMKWYVKLFGKGAEFRKKMLACVQPTASENDRELEIGKKQEGRLRFLPMQMRPQSSSFHTFHYQLDDNEANVSSRPTTEITIANTICTNHRLGTTLYHDGMVRRL
jgi:hypothetical protein